MTSFDSAPGPQPAAPGPRAEPDPHGAPLGSSVPLTSVDPVPSTDVSARSHAPPGADGVPHGLRDTAGYAWRLVVLAVAVYLAFVVLAELTLVAVAVFVGLVIAALMRPLVDLFARALPEAWPSRWRCC
jgi:hypothetical protein